MSGAVKLQVAVLCYNHQNFISQCIESIFNQRTSYPYEVLVFEDFSTDGSRELLRELEENYPKLKVIYNEKNLGDFWNFRSNFPRLTAEYIALIDGDDYWVDQDKIEKSLNFLTSNPNYAAYAQNVRVLDLASGKTGLLHRKSFSRNEHSLEDLISGYCYHHTSGIIARNVFSGRLPTVYFDERAGDWLLSILYAEHGKFRYDSEVGSVYRVHRKGFWSRLTAIEQAMANMDAVFVYNQLFNRKYEAAFEGHWLRVIKLLVKLVIAGGPAIRIKKYFWLWCTYRHSPGFIAPIRVYAERKYREFLKVDSVKLRRQ